MKVGLGMRKSFLWQWAFFLVGLMVMALGITLTIKGKAIGTSPWDVLHIGLYKQVGLTIGSWSILTGLFIIVTTSIFLKQWPRLATWLNMLLIGSFIDFFNWLLPNTTVIAFGGVFYRRIFCHEYGLCALYFRELRSGAT